MNLNDSPHKQLEDLIAWMRQTNDPESPPGAQTWAHICRGLEDRALFIETFLLREVKDLPGPDRYDRPLGGGWIAPRRASEAIRHLEGEENGKPEGLDQGGPAPLLVRRAATNPAPEERPQ